MIGKLKLQEASELTETLGKNEAAKKMGISEETLSRYLRLSKNIEKNFTEEIEKSSVSVFERGDVTNVSGKAFSLEDLLQKAKVNLELWEVESYEIKSNSWDVTLKSKEKDIVTKTNEQFYIRVRLKKRKYVVSLLSTDIIEQIASKIIKPIHVNISKSTVNNGILRFTDSHIGMDTNPEGISLYPTIWNKETQKQTFLRMIEEAANYFDYNTHLYIEDLGDLPDGYDNMTARGGHYLPQNMSTEEISDFAVELKFMLIYSLLETGKFSQITVYNACNDNHGGSMTYLINAHFKTKVELSFPGVVNVNNVKEFIGHYNIGPVVHILTHGKDKKQKKFGFPAKPNPEALQFVHDYMDYHDLRGKVRLHKGDNHQQYNDYTSSHRFEWNSYLPLSPSSEWVQSNYGKALRGFVMEKINIDNLNINIQPIFL